MTLTTKVTGVPEQRRHVMQVRKRNGDLEPVDVNKIVKAVELWVADLDEVDPLRVATKTISGLYDGATTAELDKLSIQTAAELIGEEPQYSKLAARLLAAYVDKEVRLQGVASFSQSIRYAFNEGLIGEVRNLARLLPALLPGTRASSTTPSTSRATCGSSTSACAPSRTVTCCATPPSAWSWRPRSTGCCVSPAGCRRTRVRRSASTG